MHTYFCESGQKNGAGDCDYNTILSNAPYFFINQKQLYKIAQNYNLQYDNKYKTSRVDIHEYNMDQKSAAAYILTDYSPLKSKCAAHSTHPVHDRLRNLRRNHSQGSAAIEAVCVLPILFLAFLVFYMIGQIYIMENQIYQAARNTADYLAEYAYISECIQKLPDEASGSGEVMTEILGIGMANARLQKELKDNSRVDRYVKGGRQGIYILSTNLLDEEGYITFVLHYQIQLQLPFLPSMILHIRIPIRQKAYVGYIPDQETPDGNDIYVYVTEHGSVYHWTKNCSHLKVSIRPISAYVLAREYKKLPPCEYCGELEADIYYLTEYGNCYHSSSSCSGLKRTIHRVRLREVEGMNVCASCGGG